VTVLALAVLLAGCNAGNRSPRTPAAVTLAGTLGERSPVPAAAASTSLIMQAEAAPAAPPEKPLCDAPSLNYLVGHPRKDIPVPADLSRRRVSCTSCPGADDHRPDRTDILFDIRTGLITAVTCG
jgi:hypothetical protein